MGSISTKNRLSRDCTPCVWMQADVVRKKFCESDYDCPTCRFDRAMVRAARENKKLSNEGRLSKGKRGRIVSWKEKLKERSPWKRPCIHHLKGRINFRSCMNDYECGRCEFDQYFSDQYTVHAVVRPVDVLEIEGFKMPQGYYFHRGHAWAKIEEGSSVRVGVDDFALRLLGPLDRIKAPLMGKEVKQGRGDILVEREENRAKILSPVSGVVTSINPKLMEQGRLANQDPFAEGWVMTVHSTQLRQDLRNLMINTETQDFMGQEVERLYEVIEEVGGPLSADGGRLGEDLYGNMPQIGWERLTRLFLHN